MIWFTEPLDPPQFHSPFDHELSPQLPELPEKEFPFQEAAPLEKALSPTETSTMSTEEDAWLLLPPPFDAAVGCCEVALAEEADDAAGRGPTKSGTMTTEILWITVLHTVTVSSTTGSSGPSSFRSLSLFNVGYVDPTWKSVT